MNLGKHVVWTPKHHLQIFDGGAEFRNPSRKGLLHFASLGSSGTVWDQWLTDPVLSDEAIYWPDDERWLFYKWTLPANPDYTFEMRWTLAERVPLPASGLAYRSQIVGEAFDDGVLLGRWEGFFEYMSTWSNPPTSNVMGPTWTDKSDPMKWNTGQVSFWPAKWEDDPDYQPYHTRP